MTRPITVWAEIPVTDLNRSVAFYNSVFGYEMAVDTSGPVPMAVLGNQMEIAGGHLYNGTPSTSGPTVHLALPDDLDAGSDRVRASGGEIIGDAIALPSGRFIYARDPDGNSIGLFEGAS